jgi:hypothetical protein
MTSTLEHIFIDTIPDELEEGVLYISLRFRVIMHSCCCGCKNKVVTPLSPVRWKMTFDGKHISLSPSIGNWNSECQSHYWIENSRVVLASKWKPDKVTGGKNYERRKRSEYYKKINGTDASEKSKKTKEKKNILKILTQKIKKKR